MQTQYIYSASRVNTLSQYLLTTGDIDRLLVAGAGNDLQSALKETYLAQYLLQDPDGDVGHAIEATLVEAKNLIHSIAPNGDMFRVLWVQYDIHNLRVFAKAKAVGKTYDQVVSMVSKRGMYDPLELYEYAEQGELDRRAVQFQASYDQALQYAQVGEIGQIDVVFDKLLFTTISQMAKSSNDQFIRQYVQVMVDLYNLKSKLRVLRQSAMERAGLFVAGGSFDAEAIVTMEQTVGTFSRFRNTAFWSEALAVFVATGNTTELDVKADEYMVMLAKEASFDMFSSASLFLYYLLTRQSAANIRTITVGKNSGMNAEDIRSNLRLAYVNQ
jgi:V/A-type H+-transporting ATPase subunit C